MVAAKQAQAYFGVLNWSQLRSAQYANAQHAQRRYKWLHSCPHCSGTSGVHAMKILHFCTLARSDPPPVVKGSCFHFCAHTATLGFSTRDPLAPASEAHAANANRPALSP
eukprot:scaffold25857_cov35-Phaeocystis_antarctica.AAC.1